MKFTALAIATLAIVSEAAYHKQDDCSFVGANGVQAADFRAQGQGCVCPDWFKYVAHKGCVKLPPPKEKSSSTEYYESSSSSSSSSSTKDHYDSSSSSSSTHDHYKSESTKKPRCITGPNGVEPADFIDQIGRCECPDWHKYVEHKGCVKQPSPHDPHHAPVHHEPHYEESSSTSTKSSSSSSSSYSTDSHLTSQKPYKW